MPRRKSIHVAPKIFYIPRYLFDETIKFLRSKGRIGHEGYIFWAGSTEADRAYVTTCLIPQVPTYRGRVHVDSAKMLAIQDELINRDLVLLCQIHTHPGDFGHSQGDEENAASFHEGFVSIVVPNFAKLRIRLADCYVYQYDLESGWSSLSKEEIEGRFVIEGEIVEV